MKVGLGLRPSRISCFRRPFSGLAATEDSRVLGHGATLGGDDNVLSIGAQTLGTFRNR